MGTIREYFETSFPAHASMAHELTAQVRDRSWLVPFRRHFDLDAHASFASILVEALPEELLEQLVLWLVREKTSSLSMPGTGVVGTAVSVEPLEPNVVRFSFGANDQPMAGDEDFVFTRTLYIYCEQVVWRRRWTRSSL